MNTELKKMIGILLFATIGLSSCSVQYHERRRARRPPPPPPRHREVIIVH